MATAKWEHLTCEYEPKPHKWKRELGLRGRKPRFCPKHKPEPKVASNPNVTTQPNGMRILHCELGNHDWEREPTRGRVPTSCPEHREQKVIVSAPRNENGKVTLHCANGNHDWERAPQRGKRPANCPMHPNTPVGVRTVPARVIPGSESGDMPKSLGEMTEWATEKKSPGRPKKYASKEEQEEAKLAASRERAANLDSRLRENGTHVSQWAVPYVLYKLVETKPGRGDRPPTTTWDKVTEHSPLQVAQFVNQNEKAFEDGHFRYEKEGKVINVL